MDYINFTIEKLFTEYQDSIIKDLQGETYIYLNTVAAILDYRKTSIYRMIEAGTFKAKVFGSSKFITVDSFVPEIEKKKKVQQKELRHQKLLKLANVTDDKMVEEVLKDLDPEKRKNAIANLFTEAELKQFLKTKRDMK